ncbi:hypothetical protein LEP1GSC070_2354 [Leptospira santarosai str. AIM]|nr:hypothetical protein LEP1GSC070_2354 [Leptospira santarosai str. AIM]
MVSQKYSERLCFNSNPIQAAQFLSEWKRNLVLDLLDTEGIRRFLGSERVSFPLIFTY